MYCKTTQNLFSISLLLPHPGSCGAWYWWPLLPHSGLMGSIRPLQSVWALQRSKCKRRRGGARGEAMVVELFLPVWRLTPALASAKCLDTSQDSGDPWVPLVIMDCRTCNDFSFCTYKKYYSQYILTVWSKDVKKRSICGTTQLFHICSLLSKWTEFLHVLTDCGFIIWPGDFKTTYAFDQLCGFFF